MIKRLSLFSLKYGLMPLVYYAIRFYLCFITLKVINEDRLMNHLKSGNKAIAALWHQRFFGVLNYARRFGSYAPSVMVSQSRDGDIGAQIVSRLNFRPVRGSSSRGGKEALATLVTDLAQNPFAAHVVDGPRGPLGVVKAGIIVLAHLSGAPIFPVYISFSRAWVMKSWDRFLIPKPFSTVLVRWDDPIYIPEELDEEAFESLRGQVERRMRELQRSDDRTWGWDPFF